jgi:predicted outer membrane repeat protein
MLRAFWNQVARRLNRRPARRPHYRPTLLALEDRVAPATLTVTSLADSGVGSLRAAILASQANDTIDFANALAGRTLNLTGSQLELMNNVTVQGPASGKVTINAHNHSRIFEIDAGVTASLRNLTLSNGFAPITATDAGYGGAIEAKGTLSVSNINFLNNTSAAGGGAISAYNSPSNVLLVNNAVFSNNRTLAGFGGAIGNAGPSPTPITNTLMIYNSTFTDNLAPGGGGAVDYVIFNTSPAGNYNLTLANDIFTANEGANGGAVYANDSPGAGSTLTITITNTDFNNNVATGPALSSTLSPSGFGGAIDTFLRTSGDAVSTVSISDSTFIGNQGSYGAGIDTTLRLAGTSSATYTLTRVASSSNVGTQGAGFYEELQNLGTGTLNVAVKSSTFDNNGVFSFQTSGATPTLVPGEGAGAFTTLSGTGSIAIQYANDTIADNYAVISGTAAGQMALGGGFYLEGSASPTTVSLDSLTIAYNSADTDGGGIFIDSTGVAPTVNNTIVALNTPTDLSGSATINNSILGGSPGLSDLRYNGGVRPGINGGPARAFVERQTIALLADSPAVGAGSTTLTTDEVGNVRSTPTSIGALDYAATSVTQFLVLTPWSVSAGTPFDLTVQALDQYGNVVDNYTGTVTFTLSGPGTAPTPYTFTLMDAGVATFTGGVTLTMLGDQVITVADMNNPTIMGSTIVTVMPMM